LARQLDGDGPIPQGELVKQFLEAIWPGSGSPLLANDAARFATPDKGVACSSPETMMATSAQWTEQEHNVWFASAGFGNTRSPKGKDLRHRANILHVETLWIDIDCNEGRAPGKQMDNAYATKREAREALERVCEKLGLPKPWVTDSGRGLQAWWPFDVSVTPDQWVPIADALKSAIIKVDPRLAVDTSQWTNPAALMRMPNTVNRKSDCDPVPTKIIQVGETTQVGQWEDFSKRHGGASSPTGRAAATSSAAGTKPKLGKWIRAKRWPVLNLEYENVPEEYRADLKFVECIPYLRKSEEFDPTTREGCKNFALAVVEACANQMMPYEVGLGLYLEFAQLDPHYGTEERTEADNVQFFEQMIDWYSVGGRKTATLGSVIHEARKHGMPQGTASEEGEHEGEPDGTDHEEPNETHGETDDGPRLAIKWHNPIDHPENYRLALDTLGIKLNYDNTIKQCRIHGLAGAAILDEGAIDDLHVEIAKLGLQVDWFKFSRFVRKTIRGARADYFNQNPLSPLIGATAGYDPKAPYLVKRIFGPGQVGVMVGPPGCRKTFLAADMCWCLAQATNWHGRKVHKGAVLYLDYDDGQGFANRMKLLEQERGSDKGWFARMDNPPTLGRADAERRGVAAIIERGLEHKSNVGAEHLVIVIDTYSQAAIGNDENSATDAAEFVDRCKEIAKATGAAVIVIHHTNKSGTERGSIALLGNTHWRVMVAPLKDQPGVSRAEATRVKNGEQGHVLDFRLEQKQIGKDTDIDGDPVTSCIVVPVGAAQGSTQSTLSLNPQTALDVLLDIRDTHGMDIDTGLKIGSGPSAKPFMTKGVKLKDWASTATPEMTGKGSNVKRSAFSKAKAQLLKSRVIYTTKVADEEYVCAVSSAEKLRTQNTTKDMEGELKAAAAKHPKRAAARRGK
jgi:hypothetical protein